MHDQRQGFTPMAPHLFTPDATAMPLAKRSMNPGVSSQVRAIDRADRIVERVWSWTWEGDSDPATVLFDPKRVPALAQRADEAAAEYHRRAGEGSLRYDTADGLRADYDPDDPAEQGVVRIWRVGSRQVYVVRERWRDSPDRVNSTTDYFTQLFEFLVEQLDYHDCTKFGCDGNCDLKCNVHIAKACGGVTRMLPVNRGTLVLLFRCCTTCEVLAAQAGTAWRRAANRHGPQHRPQLRQDRDHLGS